MAIEKMGPIEVIIGENQSKVPFSTSLLINGQSDSVLIDCGGGRQAFDYIKQKHITEIYLTHYHLDHIWGTYLFPDAHVTINRCDFKKLSDPLELAKASGIYFLQGKEKASQWIDRQMNKPDEGALTLRWKSVMNIVNGCYEYEKEIDAAGTKLVMLHTPGHTEGFCCPYFPEYGVLMVGDFDLTSFGPWYMDADSDIDAFLQSAKRTLETDAEYFITAHHKGSFKRKDYEEQLKRYIDKVFEREEKTKRAVMQGIPPKDIVYQEIFYFLSNHRQNTHYLQSEIMGIAKHMRRLIKQGYDFEDYFQSFISHFNLDIDYLDYRSEQKA